MSKYSPPLSRQTRFVRSVLAAIAHYSMPAIAYLRRSPYSTAILSVGLSLVLMLALDPLARMTQSPFLLFFGAVVVSAWQSGIRSGMVATALAALISNYFFLEPRFAFTSNLSDGLRLAVFILECILISVLCGSLRTTNQQLDRNVLKLKASEESLQTANQRITDILESITDGFYTLDRQWRFTHINGQAEQTLGRSRAELLGRSIWEIVPESRESVFEQSVHRVVKERVPVVFEAPSRLHPGRWFEVHINPLSEGLAVYFQDVTERKNAEVELHRSENRYRTLANAVPQMMWVNDADGSVQFFNQQWIDYTGMPLEQNLKEWAQAIHPEDVQFVLSARSRAIQANEAYELEVRIKRSDRTYRWHLARVVPLKDEAGRVLNWFGTATDIHTVKQVEEALRQSEERFRLATRAVDGVIYDWDVQAGTAFRSEGLYRLIGVHPEKAPTRKDWWGERIHPDDLARIESVMAPILEGSRDRYEFEYRVRHEDGHWVDVWDRGYLIRDSEGKLVRVVGSTADITRRKQMLERERAARQEAEAANRIKDEFLAVLSHELRSPLNPILGWARLLRTKKLDEAKTTQALETIERNAKLQSELIEDLLDVSRILRGKLNLNAAPVNLTTTIQAAIETVRLAAEAKSIEIEAALDPDVGQVLGDPNRLQQVVWNLLSNAVKFTPEGGHVEVKLEQFDAGDRRDRGDRGDRAAQTPSPPSSPSPSSPPSPSPHAQITVSDTGQGIAPDFLPYVFDYFRQADGATTRKFGGLGLGLAIVRHLVELHGGTVHAASTGEGLGATFTVRLPLMSAHSVANVETQPSEPVLTLTGIQILVVDDDADTREFVAFVLEQAGANVLTAASASEALARLTQSQPHLLLSDIGMPEMDGYMLMRQVRTLPPEQGGSIPAIALTAFAGEMNQQQALAAGFQMHISKPVEPEHLISRITRLVALK